MLSLISRWFYFRLINFLMFETLATVVVVTEHSDDFEVIENTRNVQRATAVQYKVTVVHTTG